MGITKWFSRFQMPNAAQSILLQDEPRPELKPTSEISSSTNTAKAQTTQLKPNPTQVTTKQTSPISKLPPLTTKPSSTVVSEKIKPKTKSKTPHFRYQGICINKVFCLVPLTMDIQQDISQTQLSFLQNVIFAKFNEKPIIAKRYTYQWPLFQHDRAEQGSEVAQSFFKEQLITHQKESNFNNIWIFGNLLDELEIDSQTLNQAVKHSDMIILPTLEQSMRSAFAKQSLWQLIK